MRSFSFILASLALLFYNALGTGVKPRMLGHLKVNQAGFTNWFVHKNAKTPSEKYTLLLSTFSPVPFTRDTTFAYRHIGRYLNNLGGVERIDVDDDLTWPREPGQAPDDVFGFPAVSQPDGFLVPFKDDGSINIIDVRDWQNPVKYDIAKDPSDDSLWFYHRVIWKDMDGDGLKDAVTNRAHRSILGKFNSEFVWFKHPSEDALNKVWKPNVLSNDVGDTFLMEADLPIRGQNKTINCILTIGYFSRKLVIYWSEHPQGLWTDINKIRSRVVDTFGKYFDLNLHDMNNDGKTDLVVTVNSLTNGSLHVYLMPDDFRTGKFQNLILASGFAPRSGMRGAGSPGTFSAFYPNATMQQAGGKPWLLMSGDDDGRQYLLTPHSSDPKSWAYNMTTLLDEGPGNIVGKPAVEDVNGDGYADIFIPAWNQGKLYVYTYKP